MVLAYGWSVVALPLAIALLVGLVGRFLGRGIAYVSALAPAWVLFYGIVACFEVLSAAEKGGVLARGAAVWLPAAGDGGMAVGWAVDGLTGLMLVVVGMVALLVMVFSSGYMAGERGLPRYFATLSLFTASMSLLVLADGFLGLFIGWELVGACSYLLIGFWFTKPAAAKAAVKAFLTTRVGDIGLLLALALLWREVGDLSYAAVFGMASALPGAVLTSVSLLLLFGAVGKSAQFPLHIWLPDAMEGPTPVSALIHAATMVAAGVFLIVRIWPLYSLSATAAMVTLAIGGFTAIAAACAAAAQRDIKKVLAYSTISQLGFMFAALGAGAWEAALFHLVTHAMFKALLFLGSGSVIHGCGGVQDVYEMGGLFKRMPITGATWAVGALALAGVPPLAGFFSKDEILHGVWGVQPLWAAVLFGASLLTAFYVARTTRLAFFGTYRGAGHPHEGGPEMQLPLLVLAVGAAIFGVTGGVIAALIGGHHGDLDPGIALASAGIAIVGLLSGWFTAASASDPGPSTSTGKLIIIARGGWGGDALVNAMLVGPVTRASALLDVFVEGSLINRIAEGTGPAARRLGRGFTSLQSGDAQWYAIMSGAGAVALLALVAYLGRGF